MVRRPASHYTKLRKRYNTKTPLSKRDYNDDRYKKLRVFVRKRDKHTCQFPGCGFHNTKGKLEVHHILRWWDYPALRYSSRNAVTLCKKCHRKVTGKETIYAKMFYQIIQSKKEQMEF
jgi:5-methylcytosine-specific restriction endonuclease McrA